MADQFNSDDAEIDLTLLLAAVIVLRPGLAFLSITGAAVGDALISQ